MDKELVGPSQSEHGPAFDPSNPPAPTPPRLTPNPMLLDSPVPSQTPVTSSPPPPLTPAPSLSVPKMVAARTSSPHVLVPAPPKLTSTTGAPLRTYARPILPAASKTTLSSPFPASGDVTSPSATSSSTVTTLSTKTSTTLTNGDTRTVSTPTSNTITPFHTPASPPGRQASQPLPVSSAGIVRTNQSASAVRQRASQQALLLGKGLKGSGQDQVLLRAQMLILTSAMRPGPSSSSSSSSANPASAQLQSLTLRPPPPGALAIPPSLCLKPPSSLLPPLSRPQTALFPPLRPRPPASTTTTESSATPGRHLAVPPPTLYSPVRAVPLRPRLHSVKAASPRVTSPLQKMTASSRASPVGFKSCSAPQSKTGANQSQLSSLPASFESSPSASRQLQIIAFSSARQPPSFPQTSAVVTSPEPSSQSKRTLSGHKALSLPQSPSSPPRLQPQTLSPKGGGAKESDGQPGGFKEGSVAENDQRDKGEEEGDKMEQDVAEEGPSKMEVREEGEETSSLVNQTSETVKDSKAEPETIADPVLEPLPVQNQSPALPRDLQNPSQEDISENMSDNHSALSSLSSQSPPSSPFIGSSLEAPPQPVNLSQSKHGASNGKQSVGVTQLEPEPRDQSEEAQVGGAWKPRAWPEGCQVLTHLVEGFVIQEGLQPFPVNRSSLLLPEKTAQPQEVNGTNGKAALPVTESSEAVEHSSDSDEEAADMEDAATRSGHRDRAVLHCQFCGKRGHAHNFMRSKRFCSTSCARGFNVRLTKRLRALSTGSRTERPRPVLNRAESVPGKPLLLRLPRDLWSAGRREREDKEEKVIAAQEEEQEEEEDDEEEEQEEEMEVGGEEEEEEDDEEEEEPPVAMTTRIENQGSGRRSSAVTTPTSTFEPTPCQWSVEEVTNFIRTLPGCGEVADAFRLQEIDGQALLLLTEDHLMTSMNIKLGPALKICAHINALKNQ
ncbi:uncharacterized protein [Nerophis lumbriciformis]|uniref:uncharacterized protein n=1 Tax=Nerophis lumbriciformis TaxID=546530 RepID=UPI002ADFA690|nr:polyhomeotic-like protein 3 [Nerophis lumbriciformis]